jgi:DNA-directed RNA polymerase subunit M/transcription elongation factor TFIIS
MNIDNINKFNKIIDNEKISKNIVESIHKFSIEYATINNTPYIQDSIFDTKFQDIYDLLNNKKSILSALLNNKIDPKQIAFMKAEELDPDKYENFIKKKELEEYKKNDTGDNTFTCSKCKESKVKITQLQTRAGDEPPTIFVNCLKCGHTFKF